MTYIFINSERELIELVDSRKYDSRYTYFTSHYSLKKQEHKAQHSHAGYYRGTLDSLTYYYEGQYLEVRVLNTAEDLMKCEGEI